MRRILVPISRDGSWANARVECKLLWDTFQISVVLVYITVYLCTNIYKCTSCINWVNKWTFFRSREQKASNKRTDLKHVLLISQIDNTNNTKTGSLLLIKQLSAGCVCDERQSLKILLTLVVLFYDFLF